jgi:Ribbon-helix-helix domain
MDDTTAAVATAVTPGSSSEPALIAEPREVVSTHVLVEPEKVDALRELSRRTRIAQSEYLREAVDDLLSKYHRLPSEE